ncbi:beta-xylosidase [Paraliobacillus ryukyuensis]|uniref:Periplasmic beta-glucosidase n=1 Tax=Paraliobacillus ryukyuensis TaxID=200904 RepID=A0A366DTY2_9BACI|nr:beta-glucosidase BglX [Paraliobacillus ryukyuensis]RBO93551.1 beta-glucosidase [Paraliobacillus ryukyuensis]
MINSNHLENLLNEMTIDEKIGQLLQVTVPFLTGASSEGQVTGPMEEMGLHHHSIRQVGSVLGSVGAKEVKQIQQNYLKESRLAIPLLFMSDVIHGYRTVFPVPLAMGCSWDVDLVKKSAEIAAKEASVSGLHVTFSPMVDLVRDPRWGRVVESTGEDPYLNQLYAKAFVEGYQGEDLQKNPETLAACVKHFAGYGAPEGGRDYNTVDMSDWMQQEYYFPAYRTAIEAGAALVMTSFNIINGIPASANQKLLRDTLRKDWGFEGTVISDWGAVKELIPHGVASDEKDAAKKAITAGVDIEMMSTAYLNSLKDLVIEGVIDEKLIDEAVLRILELKKHLGLFENPFRGANEQKEKELLLSATHREIAKQLAIKSSVLLKNERKTLPLDKSQQIALIGPYAESQDLMGPWSLAGKQKDVVSLAQGMRNISPGMNVNIAKGCNINEPIENGVQEAFDVANTADVIVLALGESEEMSGEAGSRTELTLPNVQLELLQKIKSCGKPIVVVLFNGRPLDLREVEEVADAILEAWFPGTEGGSALADLLFGSANPSGKLTMSFPHSVGQVPIYYNYFQTGRPKEQLPDEDRFASKYLDAPNEPLYCFGYGLSYTTYSYSDLKLSSNTLSINNKLDIEVNVKNTGQTPGEEIVQLYVRDLVGEVVRPVKELKDFKRVHLDPGEEKEISFQLSEEQLRYHHTDLKKQSDTGDFEIYVGSNSSDTLSMSFQLEKNEGGAYENNRNI